MQEEQRPSRRSKGLLIAAAFLSIASLGAMYDGNYWLALSQAGVAVGMGLLYAGAEEREGIFTVIAYTLMGVSTLSIVILLATS